MTGRAGRGVAVVVLVTALTALAPAAEVPVHALPSTTAPIDPPPDVVGLPYQVAEKTIAGWRPREGWRGLAQSTPNEPLAEVEPVTVVVRQGTPFDDPADAPGEEIDYVRVPLTLGVRMPQLIGETRAAATETLSGLALTHASWSPEDAAQDDMVLTQSPSAGELVSFRDPVTVSFVDYVPVPNVVGLSVAEATRSLELAGLMIGASGSGRVTSQQPAADALVERGSAVTVTVVNRGLVVPNIVGLTLEQARQSVEQARLRFVAPAGVGAQRRVTAQSPAPGTPARRGERVQATFEPATVTVPNLVGLPVDLARSRVGRRGLVLDASADVGDVGGQQPSAGSRVAIGTTVSVTVGVTPTVPNLLGLTVAEAHAAVTNAGLRLEAPDGDGTIVEQVPPAESPADPGDLVTVSLASPGGSRPTSALLGAAAAAALLAGAAGVSGARRWRRNRWLRRHVGLSTRVSRRALPARRPAQGSLVRVRVVPRRTGRSGRE